MVPFLALLSYFQATGALQHQHSGRFRVVRGTHRIGRTHNFDAVASHQSPCLIDSRDVAGKSSTLNPCQNSRPWRNQDFPHSERPQDCERYFSEDVISTHHKIRGVSLPNPCLSRKGKTLPVTDNQNRSTVAPTGGDSEKNARRSLRMVETGSKDAPKRLESAPEHGSKKDEPVEWAVKVKKGTQEHTVQRKKSSSEIARARFHHRISACTNFCVALVTFATLSIFLILSGTFKRFRNIIHRVHPM